MFLTIAKVRYVTARRSVEIEIARGGGRLEYKKGRGARRLA